LPQYAKIPASPVESALLKVATQLHAVYLGVIFIRIIFLRVLGKHTITANKTVAMNNKKQLVRKQPKRKFYIKEKTSRKVRDG
jgi:hypothetical protein